MMVAGAQGGSYALTIWLPTYLKTVRHISSVGTGSYLLVLILGAFFGFVSGAYLADGIGRKPTFMLSAVGSIVLTHRLSVRADQQRLDPAGRLPARLCLADHVLADGLVHDRAVSHRGARRRARASATTPGAASARCSRPLVGFLAARLGLGTAIAVFSLGAYGVMIVALLLLPETRGRSLASLEHSAPG